MLKVVWVGAMLLAAGLAAFRGYRRRGRIVWERIVVVVLVAMAILYVAFSPLTRAKRS